MTEERRGMFRFESFVNSEGCKALSLWMIRHPGLRALLIQKGVKLFSLPYLPPLCLRALLIQKGVKRSDPADV